ncbi:PQQ-like beta-propeller repeat protein [Aquimarina sp. TRL1]|uniref:outer membrane protein assembly factor BamB family protein n=1 Tax=Aquimarina sp. (strain TRL1) TaxID=2736252 RepID=UPI00158BDDAA|nr:PQQ-binding-like beta-propeller repeat protein [Aquimarina sp. TRL1]QKX06309.1 PQQ-like beta-propeller repeat protein [Aquimarina sp. TRL1]
MKKIILIALLILSSVPTIYSQKKIWEVNLKEQLYEVGWIKQSNDGYIIASGAKGLLAMNNATGEIIWHNKELKAIDKNTFLTIDGLPLFYIEYVPIAGKTRGIIINSSNGNIVYDTKDEGARIKNFSLYPDNKIILFELLKDKTRKLMCFSLESWSKKWVADLGESKGLIQKYFSGSFINQGPYFSKENNLILGIKEKIYTINAETGAIVWTHEANKKIKALVYSEKNNSLYLGVKKAKTLKVLQPATGEDITPGKLKLRGTLIDVRPDKDNNLILVETEGFNIIDPQTNEFKWKKSFKIDYLDEVIPHEKGLIAIGKDEKDGTISLVDPNGKKIWTSKVKGYAYYITPTENGVLYVSTERSNILDYDKGKDVWDKDVKFKSIPAVTFDEQEKKVMLFENKKGYKFDLSSGKIDLFAQDIELENVKRKTPLMAEYVAGAGYLIQTPQHISLLTPDGAVKYSKYFDPPSSIGGLVQVAQLGLNIAGVDLDIKGNLDNIKMLSSLSGGALRASNDQTDAVVEESVVAGLYTGPDSSSMTPVFEVTKKRFFNSKSIQGHKFIVAKIKSENAPTKHHIYMINKKTGAIDTQIELLDKTPNYFIDEIDNVVFINEKNHLISAHQF